MHACTYRRYNVIDVIDMVYLASWKVHRRLLGSCVVHNCAVSIDLTESFSSDGEIRVQSKEKERDRESSKRFCCLSESFVPIFRFLLHSVVQYIIICSSFSEVEPRYKSIPTKLFYSFIFVVDIVRCTQTHACARVVAERVIGVNENHSIDA